MTNCARLVQHSKTSQCNPVYEKLQKISHDPINGYRKKN